MKVSYQKRWDNEGTVYDQTVTMTLSEMAHLKLAIDAERARHFPRVKEYDPNGVDHAEIFLKPLSFPRVVEKSEQEKVIYLNHTQRRFMELFLLEETRSRVKDRNTCIKIIDNNK